MSLNDMLKEWLKNDGNEIEYLLGMESNHRKWPSTELMLLQNLVEEH